MFILKDIRDMKKVDENKVREAKKWSVNFEVNMSG